MKSSANSHNKQCQARGSEVPSSVLSPFRPMAVWEGRRMMRRSVAQSQMRERGGHNLASRARRKHASRRQVDFALPHSVCSAYLPTCLFVCVSVCLSVCVSGRRPLACDRPGIFRRRSSSNVPTLNVCGQDRPIERLSLSTSSTLRELSDQRVLWGGRGRGRGGERILRLGPLVGELQCQGCV